MIGAQTGLGADGGAIVRQRREWVPRAERVAVNVDAVVHRSDKSTVAVRLRNMSYDGCGFVAVCSFEVGERVRIGIRGQGYIEAEMRWSSDNHAGAKYLPVSHV
jgi:hypothetical protein